MIKEEQVVTILRFLSDGEDPDDPMAKFSASCTLLWESKHVIWVKALVGDLSNRNLRNFAKFLLDRDIHTVKSIRANGSLPFSTRVEGNYCEIDVLIQKPRLEKFARG